MSKVCAQIVLKCLYLARFGRPDILWSVNKLARAITKWTKAFDKRLARLIYHIHHTSELKQYCYVGSTVQQCRLGLFQDSDFAGDPEDSKSTSGGIFHAFFGKSRVFGSHTFVPISWMCKKQTSVSHSSTEAEIISFEAGLRMDGIPAFVDSWIRDEEEPIPRSQAHLIMRQIMYHKARDMLRKAKLPKNGSCDSILDVWHTDADCQKSLSDEGWTEEKIRQCDALALEDHSNEATPEERDDGKGTGRFFRKEHKVR